MQTLDQYNSDAGFPEDRTVHVLYDELFYEGSKSFTVLVLEGPFVGGRKARSHDDLRALF